jgi:hypothetical protein|nr:MAG TPA: hypothetical protein [Caudoviricetes sp.]
MKKIYDYKTITTYFTFKLLLITVRLGWIYLLFSAISYDWDIPNWSELLQGFFIFFALVFCVELLDLFNELKITITNDDKKDKEESNSLKTTD